MSPLFAPLAIYPRPSVARPPFAFAFALLLASAASVGCTSIPAGRSAIDDVTVQGAHALDPGAVADKLATAATPKFLGLARGIVYDYEIYDPSVLQRDMARVERYYRGKGFLEAHARAGRVVQVGPGHVTVEILVDEGPPVMNRAVTLTGLAGLPADVVTAVTTKVQTELSKDKRFDEDDYKSAKSDLKRALTDRGYAYATVDADASIDLASHSADYAFKVDPGPACTFGPITITGLDPDGAGPRPQEIDEAPLRRAMNIDEGDTFSTADIDTATQSLLDLEVFSAVHIDPQLPEPPPAHPVIPLAVTVEPTKLRQLRLGGGFEFDEIKTDLHILAGWEDHNFLGGLRDLSIDAQPGVVPYPLRAANPIQAPTNWLPEEHFKIQFRQPSFLEARTSGFVKPELNVYPFLVLTNPAPGAPVVGYLESKVAVGADRPFGKISVSVAFNVQLEDPFYYVPPTSADPLPPSIFLTYPQLVTKLDLRDNPTHPHAGIYLANDFQFATGALGSTAHDVRVQPEARGYIPIARRVTLAVRGSVGFLFPSNYQIAKYLPNNDTSDETERTREIEETYFRGFTSGGPSTNRGFPVRGIAPYGLVPYLLPATASSQVANNCTTPAELEQTGCALPIAGLTLWEASVETRFEVSGPFSTAVFCDAGDVSPYQTDFRFGHLHLSCGVGARYDTPVGPIRFDLGYRVQPLQVIGYPNETAAANANPVNGEPPQLFSGVPLAIAFGIGEAY